MQSMPFSCGILLTLAQAIDFSSYTDESISLLQLRAATREIDEADLHDADLHDAYDENGVALLHGTEDDAYHPGQRPTLPPKEVGPFGPDGTWNTPWCKDIQGCIPYCPPGCNGAARWMWPTYGNSRLGVPAGNANSKLRHFQACEQGKRVPGAVGAPPRVAWMNCLGSENSTKAPAIPPEWDSMKENPVFGPGRRFKYPTMRMPYLTWSMTPYGHEYCPVDCVNDCAYFFAGNFNHCGVTTARGWTGYARGNSPAVGSNQYCNTDYVYYAEVQGYLWCGERTTTTTTTTTTTEALPAPEVEPEVDPEDDAEAVGDPHMTTNTGHHFDMAMPEP